MRWLLLIGVVWLALPTAALARPTVAIVPLEGDRGDKVERAIAEALADDAKVIRGKKVARALEDLGVRGELDTKDVKQLAGKLDADVVVDGRVKKKKVELRVTLRGKKPARVELAFKSASTSKFKRELRDELSRRIAKVKSSDDDDDDDAKKKKKTKRLAKADDDDAKKKVKKTKKKKKKKKKQRRGGRDDDDDGGDDDDDDDDDDDGDGPGVAAPRHAATQAALRINAGVAFARRGLTYATAGSTNAPPPVGTAAPAGRLEAELYPGSFSTLKGVAAGLGVVLAFEQTLGLAIDVPGGAGSAPIDQGHYAVGARYRATFGAHSVAAGVSYWRRRYIADRSDLAMPTALDAPDVDYTAVAPGLVARIGATPKIGVFFSAEVPLMMSTGGIQANDSYGPADVLAFEVHGGLDYLLGEHYALRFAADLTQIGLSFTQKTGTMSALRGVTNATDRMIGVAATFAVFY